MKTGELSVDVERMVSEVTYFDLSGSGAGSYQEGPFLVWFQLEYDTRQEGPLAVVLFNYDKNRTKFTEVGLYEAHDGQSMIIQIIEKGTYAISIQSLDSTKQKYAQKGLLPKELRSDPMF